MCFLVTQRERKERCHLQEARNENTTLQQQLLSSLRTKKGLALSRDKDMRLIAQNKNEHFTAVPKLNTKLMHLRGFVGMAFSRRTYIAQARDMTSCPHGGVVGRHQERYPHQRLLPSCHSQSGSLLNWRLFTPGRFPRPPYRFHKKKHKKRVVTIQPAPREFARPSHPTTYTAPQPAPLEDRTHDKYAVSHLVCFTCASTIRTRTATPVKMDVASTISPLYINLSGLFPTR